MVSLANGEFNPHKDCSRFPCCCWWMASQIRWRDRLINQLREWNRKPEATADYFIKTSKYNDFVFVYRKDDDGEIYIATFKNRDDADEYCKIKNGGESTLDIDIVGPNG